MQIALIIILGGAIVATIVAGIIDLAKKELPSKQGNSRKKHIHL